MIFFWLIWPFRCLVFMFLTVTKYHENFAFYRKFLSSLGTKIILKIPSETFLRITRYILMDPVLSHSLSSHFFHTHHKAIAAFGFVYLDTCLSEIRIPQSFIGTDTVRLIGLALETPSAASLGNEDEERSINKLLPRKCIFLFHSFTRNLQYIKAKPR